MTPERSRSSLRRSPTSGDALVFLGFTASFLVAIALVFFPLRAVLNEFLRPWGHTAPSILAGLTLFGPPVVAAWNVYRGGTPLGSVAIGCGPGVAFVVFVVFGLLVLDRGEPGLAAVLALLFGVYGLVAGIAGTIAYLVVDRTRRALA